MAAKAKPGLCESGDEQGMHSVNMPHRCKHWCFPG